MIKINKIQYVSINVYLDPVSWCYISTGQLDPALDQAAMNEYCATQFNGTLAMPRSSAEHDAISAATSG